MPRKFHTLPSHSSGPRLQISSAYFSIKQSRTQILQTSWACTYILCHSHSKQPSCPPCQQVPKNAHISNASWARTACRPTHVDCWASVPFGYFQPLSFGAGVLALPKNCDCNEVLYRYHVPPAELSEMLNCEHWIIHVITIYHIVVTWQCFCLRDPTWHPYSWRQSCFLCISLRTLCLHPDPAIYTQAAVWDCPACWLEPYEVMVSGCE